MRTALITLLTSTLAAAVTAQPQDSPANDAIARAAEIEFIPDSLPCAPELFGPVQARLDAFTRDEVVAMLASDDPHAIGVSIHLASSRHYLELILANPQCTDDRRPSIPNLICTPHAELPPAEIPRTVRERYQESVKFWFGTCGSTTEKQAALFPPESDAFAYAHPWRMRIDLSLNATQEDKAALKAEILALAPGLRWVVLANELPPPPGEQGLFTEAEIRAELKRLSPGLKQAIQYKTAPLPPDPIFKDGVGPYTAAEALINDKPLPDPYDSLPEHIKKMIVDR